MAGSESDDDEFCCGGGAIATRRAEERRSATYAVTEEDRALLADAGYVWVDATHVRGPLGPVSVLTALRHVREAEGS